MKKPFLVLTSFLLLIFACVKESDVSMDFKLTGANNFEIVRGTDTQLGLTVFYLGGEKEDVTVSAQGLPAGIHVNFDHPTDEPDFELTAFINADLNMTPGIYPVTFLVTSESGKVFTRDFEITVKDPANLYPTLNIAGASTINHTLNDPWVEPGYYAIDVEDGDITSQVTVTGTVNPNLVGLYILTYKVVDSDGDSAVKTRNVQVLNSNTHMQGAYNCTTSIQGGITFSWTAQISTSRTTNYNFVLSKISDCYGTLTNPMELEIVPFGGNNVNIPPQIVYGINSLFPSHCDSAYHYISGSGTIDYNPPYTFVLTYTDLYEDSNGLQHTYVKTDTYVKSQ